MGNKDKMEKKRERKKQKDKELIEQMNKRLSGKQRKVDYKPGDIITMSDGAQYQVQPSGAWVKIK
jgi:hypothetical protein